MAQAGATAVWCRAGINKREGIVVLKVWVGVDGTPRKVEVDPATHAAPSLVKAASDTAVKWLFSPTMKWQAGEGYARVPRNSVCAPPAPNPLAPPPHISSSS